MILCNTDILAALDNGSIEIDPIAGSDPSRAPFNTSSVDLRLGTRIVVPNPGQPVVYDLAKPFSAEYLATNSRSEDISTARPYILEPGRLVLAQTKERVHLRLSSDGGQNYSARVEGKSSRARLGLIVHFTAPTIHTGFNAPITLEMINLGPNPICLAPDVYICQLIIEEVRSSPVHAPNQFSGQYTPEGLRAAPGAGPST